MRAFTASFMIHLGVKTSSPLPTPHNKQLYQTSIYSWRGCQINPSPFQKSAHCIFPLETSVSANLCGCEFPSLKYKLQRAETLQAWSHHWHHVTCAVYQHKGPSLLAVMFRLLSIARKFLEVQKESIDNRRLSNEEKVPFTHTHACTEGKRKRAGDAFLTGLTPRQTVGLKRFHSQSYSLSFSVKIFWFASDILLRVQRIKSTTIAVCPPYSGKANREEKL